MNTVKKGLAIFPSPAEMSLTKLSLAEIIYPVPGRFGKKKSSTNIYILITNVLTSVINL